MYGVVHSSALAICILLTYLMDKALQQDILDLLRLQQGGVASVIIDQLMEVMHQLWNTANLTETVNYLGGGTLGEKL